MTGGRKVAFSASRDVGFGLFPEHCRKAAIMRKHRFYVLFDALCALAILMVDFIRAIVVAPFAYLPSISLPSPVAYAAGRLKPEYRESWRTHGLSLLR
jgi:hypothetical protein